MTSIKEYLLHIVCAAILSAIVVRLTSKNGTGGNLVKLLAGLFLSVSVLSPILSLNLNRFQFYANDLTEQAQEAAQTGTEYAEQELRRIIISRTQTYIMDKAASFGVTVDVEVVLNEYTPQSVILKGSVSPGAKAQLTAWITENLGIPKEAQQWN